MNEKITSLSHQLLISGFKHFSGGRVLWWDCDGYIQGGDPLALEYHSQLAPCLNKHVQAVLGEEIAELSSQFLIDECTQKNHKENGYNIELFKLIEGDSPIGVLCCLHEDSTDDILVSRQALDLAVETFSHDVRTHLSSTKSGLQFLHDISPHLTLSESEGKLISSRQKMYLDNITKNLSSLIGAIEQVTHQVGLLLSYVNDYRDAKKEIVSGEQLISDVLRYLPPNAKDIVDVDIAGDGEVSCSKRTLSIAIQLIINNAIYYHSITNERVKVEVTSSNKDLRLVVRFQSVGFTMKDSQAAVLQPLHLQYVHLTGSAYENVKKIVSYHKGSIDFNVNNDEIVEYRLSIPLHEKRLP